TWIASGTGDADWKFSDEENRLMVPPEDPKYTLKRLRLSKTEKNTFYFGFNHETFWPLLHEVFHRPDFDPDFWEGYKKANSVYAQSLEEEIDDGENPLVWFQDFQLCLAPRYFENLIDEDRDIRMMHFWHTPWPTAERFSLCPWREKLLDGLLANDIIEFHTVQDAKNFLNTVDRLLGEKADIQGRVLEYEGSKTYVHHSPISIDFQKVDKSARTEEVEKKTEQLKSYPYVSDNIVGVGIDRLDYAKGIPERLDAIDRFLEKYPKYQENFVFFQAGAP
ncbi:MAG: trehalose-6-phosphate synthase, partial [Candidatus Aenigmatarchaeota archaeon]